MRRSVFFIPVFILSLSAIQAQQPGRQASPPAINDFSGILSFLSSDWMEGREADARGGFMAADYISSMMKLGGLEPYGDKINPDKSVIPAGPVRSYFQNFNLIRCRVERSSLEIIRTTSEGGSSLFPAPGTDFETDPLPYGQQGEGQLVFAGYGIEAPAKGYDDYQGINVKDRIVLILEGYPGHTDTTSFAWKKLGKTFEDEFAYVSMKLRTAKKHGAMAVIVISPGREINSRRNSIQNRDVLDHAMNSVKQTEPEYEDPEYYLQGDTSITGIPCFRLGTSAAHLVMSDGGKDIMDFEKKAARLLLPASEIVQGKKLKFSISVSQEVVTVRNVLGIIRGTDTGRNIIVGSHYDHLGTRKGVIYNGADDNASGVSGMLALARAWAGHPDKPACNIIFAAWTAEEKGLLGSDWFSRHAYIIPDRLSVVINMDMISRSAPEDTSGTQLSIGTLPMNIDLRDLAKSVNSHLVHPFSLDLWDVTGHHGSDYAHFAEKKIPVMTFFSGFHDDYHTPRDVAAKTEPMKMENILKIVNECIAETLMNPPLKKSVK